MEGRSIFMCLLVLVCVTIFCFAAEANSMSERGVSLQKALKKTETSQVYATLLYGNEFLLGVRTLGKSIRDTGTTKNMVVLVSDGVTFEAIQLLKADGWIVEHIHLLANPNRHRPARFWGVYTKLKIFNMTEYEKVVYLDADTIVLKSIEDLFDCQGFCANLKHSEKLNSGVMVVEPSWQLFEDMLSKVESLYSYTGGDQGFLNSYFDEFPNAHLFNPNLTLEERKRRLAPKMERLSTLYNADVGLYMLANKWMVDESELRVVHYTLGPLKPWDWWTAWLLKPVDLWQKVRVTLEESLPGTGGGRDPRTTFVVRILVALPLLILAFIYRNLLFQIYQALLGSFCSRSFCGYARHLFYRYRSNMPVLSSISMSSTNGFNHQQLHRNGTGGTFNTLQVPAYMGALSICACFFIALLSFGIAMFLIPRQVLPWTGLLLVYEWTFFLFTIIYSKFLEAMFAWGRKLAGAVPLSTSDPSRQYSFSKAMSFLTVHSSLQVCFST
ncbi:hypothetical protein O6H91_Y511100 [Diphasiastrum complanatum]|nr:hypothetical protein O6H91_Y511100 [Diphasiastrum complanatum]